MSAAVNLVGQRFGRLTVIERVGTYDPPCGFGKQPIWRCRCDCGEVVDITAHNLKQGRTRSCGCLRRENARRAVQIRWGTGKNDD